MQVGEAAPACSTTIRSQSVLELLIMTTIDSMLPDSEGVVAGELAHPSTRASKNMGDLGGEKDLWRGGTLWESSREAL